MDIEIRPLGPDDLPAATGLLNDAVGAGFWSFDDADHALSFVAVTAEGVRGVALARLAPSADLPETDATDGLAVAVGAQAQVVLHIRELVVAPKARRAGLASRLLERTEREGAARGAGAAFAYAWLPAARPDPEAVPFYEAAGYTAGPDVAGFYADGSVAAGARCPYCGAPPCRCAARPFVKRLPTPTG